MCCDTVSKTRRKSRRGSDQSNNIAYKTTQAILMVIFCRKKIRLQRSRKQSLKEFVILGSLSHHTSQVLIRSTGKRDELYSKEENKDEQWS